MRVSGWSSALSHAPCAGRGRCAGRSALREKEIIYLLRPFHIMYCREEKRESERDNESDINTYINKATHLCKCAYTRIHTHTYTYVL